MATRSTAKKTATPRIKKRKALSANRTIQTVYYFGKQVVKVNNAVYANSAVTNCVNHMQLNHYGATHAEVFDILTGDAHAGIRRKVSGEIVIFFKREVKEGM